MTDEESFDKGMWWELSELRGKTTHNLHQPSRQNHKSFIPDPYSPMNISSDFAWCEHSPAPFDYNISLCVVSQNCIVCCRDTAFIFQMPPSLMSKSHRPASDKCLQDVHLPCTLRHLSRLVFSSPRRGLVIFSFLPPASAQKRFVHQLVSVLSIHKLVLPVPSGLCPFLSICLITLMTGWPVYGKIVCSFQICRLLKGEKLGLPNDYDISALFSSNFIFCLRLDTKTKRTKSLLVSLCV